MEVSLDRRTRKRLATRQAISDAATRLFMERGFEAVTVDEIAKAADVGRMTVFNHFPRKEDMFFDREQQVHDLFFDAVRQRDAAWTPIEAIRRLAHRLIAERHRMLPLTEGGSAFVATVMASEALKARAREMRDDFTQAFGRVLADDAKQPVDDPRSRLASALIASTWSVAVAEAHRLLRQGGRVDDAGTAFLHLIDRGLAGTAAALKGTPYA